MAAAGLVAWFETACGLLTMTKIVQPTHFVVLAASEASVSKPVLSDAAGGVEGDAAPPCSNDFRNGLLRR